MSTWTRSSFCGSGACLEAMRTGPVILVQDSKRPASSGGPLQAWSLGEWDELLGALLAGVPHPGVEPIGGGVRLGLKFPADRHEPLIFDRLEWGAFCNGVIAGEFDIDKLSSPVPVTKGAQDGANEVGPVTGGRSDLPAATGAGDNAVPPVPVAASSVVQYMQDRELGMRCGRCNNHTGNNHQGHYWKFCTVTKQMEVFHFCCPGDCGRATAWKEQYQKLVDRFAELGIAVDDRNHYLVPPKNERWVALLAAAKAMDDPKSAEPSYVLDREAILELVQRYGDTRELLDLNLTHELLVKTESEAADLLDAIRAALTPVPEVEPDQADSDDDEMAQPAWGSGPLVEHNPLPTPLPQPVGDYVEPIHGPIPTADQPATVRRVRPSGAGSAEPEHDPSTNCYCGGPEEIYPHKRGTGRHCKQRAGQS